MINQNLKPWDAVPHPARGSPPRPDLAKTNVFAEKIQVARRRQIKSFGQAFSKACGVQGQSPAYFPKRVFEGVRGNFSQEKKVSPKTKTAFAFLQRRQYFRGSTLLRRQFSNTKKPSHSFDDNAVSGHELLLCSPMRFRKALRPPHPVNDSHPWVLRL